MTTFFLAIAAIDSLAVAALILMTKYGRKAPKQSLGWLDGDYMPKGERNMIE